MAKEGGGGGGFGWALLGFLAGVAATLGLQVLIGGNGRHAEAPPVAEAPAAAPTALASSAPVAKPAKKPVVVAETPPVSAAKPAAPADAQVADDAAAAGMTSRMAPVDGGDATAAPTASN